VTGAPWHFLNFFPLPQRHGSLRPGLALAGRCMPLHKIFAKTGFMAAQDDKDFLLAFYEFRSVSFLLQLRPDSTLLFTDLRVPSSERIGKVDANPL
jgi:hypothetical protein